MSILFTRTPTLVKHKGWYSLIFYNPVTGKRKWSALGTQSHREALKLARPRIREYEAGRWNPFLSAFPTSDLTLGQAFDQYSRRDLRADTIDSTRRVLALLDPVWRDLPLTRIDTKAIGSVVLRPPAKSSQRSYYRQLHAFFGWCVTKRLMPVNPVSAIDCPKAQAKDPRYLTREQVADLLADADHHDPFTAAVIRLAIGSGLRRKEIHLLRITDAQDGHIFVRRAVKTHQFHAAPCTPMTLCAIDWMRENGTWFSDVTKDALSKGVKRRMRSAGMPEWAHLHTCRHTFASWLRMDGVPLDRIQSWLGHSSVVTTEVYAHLTPDSIRFEADKTFPA